MHNLFWLLYTWLLNYFLPPHPALSRSDDTKPLLTTPKSPTSSDISDSLSSSSTPGDIVIDLLSVAVFPNEESGDNTASRDEDLMALSASPASTIRAVDRKPHCDLGYDTSSNTASTVSSMASMVRRYGVVLEEEVAWEDVPEGNSTDDEEYVYGVAGIQEQGPGLH
jgi:hypothetical protein